MNFRRLLGSVAATGIICTSLVGAPVGAQWNVEPQLIGGVEPTVVAGQSAWVTLAWTSDTDLENFRVEVSDTDPTTTIATTTGGDVAPLRGDSILLGGEIDTVSFRIDTTEATPRTVELDIAAVWEFDGETYRYFPPTRTVNVVSGSTSDDLIVLTDGATVSSRGDGTGNWVEVGFLGLRPTIDDLSVTVTGGPEVYYPRETFTSLHHGARLHAAETDVARFWIDPLRADPGTYEVVLNISYVVDGEAKNSVHPFTLSVD